MHFNIIHCNNTEKQRKKTAELLDIYVYLMHDQISICSQLKAGVHKGEDYVK